MVSRPSVVILVAATFAFSLAAATPATAQQRHEARQYDHAGSGDECVTGFADLYDDIEPVTLTPGEGSMPGMLWEDEKLARDVYDLLENRWQLQIFGNISNAEQNHMDMVAKLFATYSLVYDFTDLDAGVYSEDHLTFRYESVATVVDSISLVEALEVGVELEVENLCLLYDLLGVPGAPDLLVDTDNDHIKLVAQNLAKGTRNHMRAFVAALDAQGSAYVVVPGCLHADVFAAIVDGERESGVVDVNGDPVASCADQDVDSNRRPGGGN